MRTCRPCRACATAMALWLAGGAPVRCEPRNPPAVPEEPRAGLPVPPMPPMRDEGQSPREARPDDKRRTLRSYCGNLGYNFLGVWTPGNRKPLLVTAGLTAPSFLLDDEGVGYFRDHPRERFGRIGSAMGGTIAISGLTVGLFSAGRIARGDRFRAATYDLSQAIIVNGVYTQALKLAVRRERPDGSNRRSFPSGHASNAFAAATALAGHYKRSAIPGYAVATYIAVSRMAASKHYFSDIVAGAGFGYGVGRLVVRRNGRPPDGPPKPSAMSFVPDRGPSGDGRGLAVVVSF